MIDVTGDIHGNPCRLSTESFYEQKEMTNQDENYVIILGDFGLVWNYEGESKQEEAPAQESTNYVESFKKELDNIDFED